MLIDLGFGAIGYLRIDHRHITLSRRIIFRKRLVRTSFIFYLEEIL